MPGAPGEIAVVYRAAHSTDLILRDELDALARSRGVHLHYLVGPDAVLSAANLRSLVPDIAQRDVFVCGSPDMTRSTHAALRRLGVPGRQINVESFTL